MKGFVKDMNRNIGTPMAPITMAMGRTMKRHATQALPSYFKAIQGEIIAPRTHPPAMVKAIKNAYKRMTNGKTSRTKNK